MFGLSRFLSVFQKFSLLRLADHDLVFALIFLSNDHLESSVIHNDLAIIPIKALFSKIRIALHLRVNTFDMLLRITQCPFRAVIVLHIFVEQYFVTVYFCHSFVLDFEFDQGVYIHAYFVAKDGLVIPGDCLFGMDYEAYVWTLLDRA